MTFVPAYALQERAVSENPDAGPQGAGWKEEEAYTLEARHHVQMVAAPLTRGSATGEGVNEPGRRQEDDVNLVVANPLEASDGHHGHSSPRGDGADNLVTAFYPTGGTHGLHDYRDGTTLPLKVGSGVEAPAGVAMADGASVRRLTPTECERLQAFPDGWTDVGGTPDSKRYAALGDAVTVNVAFWLGQRLLAVHSPV